MLLMLLAAHMLIKRQLFQLDFLALMTPAPMAMLAYKQILHLHQVGNYQELFAFFACMMIASSFTTRWQIASTQRRRQAAAEESES